MYQEPLPDEFVIYAGHVVLLRQSDPRHIDRTGQISERKAQRKQFHGKYVGGKIGQKPEVANRSSGNGL
jgi:hypothetical protein